MRQHPRLVDTALATPLLVINTAAAASVPDAPVWWMALLPTNLVLFAALYNVASRCRWHYTTLLTVRFGPT